jgi:hypothetical protein
MKPWQWFVGGRAPMGGMEHGAGTVREQAPKIHIAAFADPTEPPGGAAGISARREPQPAGKLASAAKAVNVSHGPDQRRRGYQPNARNLAQPRDLMRMNVVATPHACREFGLDRQRSVQQIGRRKVFAEDFCAEHRRHVDDLGVVGNARTSSQGRQVAIKNATLPWITSNPELTRCIRESTGSIPRTTLSPMAMGKRRQHAKQASIWVAAEDLPRSAAHPFYTRLNQILG